jgi:integrase
MPTLRTQLSDAALRALKPPTKGRVELQDTLVPQLWARLTSGGTMTFSIVTRTRAGKQVRPTLGQWPMLSLAQARKDAKDMVAAIRTGADPTAEKQAARTAERAAAARPTVAQRLTEWQHAKAGEWKPRYAAEVQRMADKIISPILGERALADVTRADWMQMIADVRSKGTPRSKPAATGTHKRPQRKPAPGTASWLYSTASSFLSHAEAMGWIEAHPLPRKGLVTAAPRPAARDRVLSDAEMIALWHASADRTPKTRCFIRLLLLTGAREDEVANIAKGEIDRNAGRWIIPSSRVKNAREITVPIGELGRAEIAAIWPDERAGDSYRLLGAIDGGGFAGFSGLKRRVDQSLAAAGHQFAPWRWHDLRRTVRTGLSRLGVNETVAELAVNHITILSGLRGIYDRHSYGQEIIDALSKWQRHVGMLVAGGNVVAFPKASA